MLELNKIYFEDCLEGMKKIDDHSIDFIVADLPYGKTANKWDTIIPSDKLWKQYERILKNKGNVALFGTGLFAYKLALSNEKLYRYDIIWKKSKCGSPLTAKYMPLKKHELILMFGHSASYYYPQMTKGTPYKRKWTPNKTNNMEYGINGVQTNNGGTRHPTTILDFPQNWRRQDQLHPTQKPVELLEWLIVSFSPKDSIVLDNTIGSGTTAIACINTNRNFIGFENNRKYFDICQERIKNYQNN
jgi:site-specific DNA-methyltransferase (adenine-specific)